MPAHSRKCGRSAPSYADAEPQHGSSKALSKPQLNFPRHAPGSLVRIENAGFTIPEPKHIGGTRDASGQEVGVGGDRRQGMIE
jgi:hypothetical protein